jgi:hypothetical protein
LTVAPSTDPWKAVAELLKKFLKLIQEQVSDKIHILTWDPDLEGTEKRLKKPKGFPAGLPKNRQHFTNYFSGYPNPKKDKISTVYLKVRLVTNEPDALPIDLDRLGQELSETIKDEMPMYFSKNPYACQAVWTKCIGWWSHQSRR